MWFYTQHLRNTTHVIVMELSLIPSNQKQKCLQGTVKYKKGADWVRWLSGVNKLPVPYYIKQIFIQYLPRCALQRTSATLRCSHLLFCKQWGKILILLPKQKYCSVCSCGRTYGIPNKRGLWRITSGPRRRQTLASKHGVMARKMFCFPPYIFVILCHVSLQAMHAFVKQNSSWD